MNFIKQLWNTVRSNRYFVAFEGGVIGTAFNFTDEALQTGHLDFSKDGIRKLLVFAIAGGFTAVRLLMRPSPGTNPTPEK